LLEANQELESRIADRTAALQTANESLRDIAGETEQHLTNEQAARREAEIANRLRDEFMATVSHELRTPLNSILGWARMMNTGTLDTRQSTKAVATIIKNAQMQNRLIEDLLDVARIISGKLQLDISETAIGEIVSHSIETARPSSDARGITIGFHPADGASERLVSGDKIRLEQIVGNLLNNSIKFTPPGGKVDVTLRSDDGFVEIIVKDSGAGIGREFLPAVFERFRQDDATINESGGLGLGLAVVRNLTELHGGTVTADSEGENKGSTFTVRLPIVQA
jgi:signal transduction histidine kinase